ncbi:MFS transporter, partial [Pseudomonas syringae]
VRPACHEPTRPEEEVRRAGRVLACHVSAGILSGCACSYRLRKYFSLAMPYLIDEGYTRGQLGVAMSSIAIAYGLSRFLMGIVSDRSDPRDFLTVGLLVSAGVMFIFGFAPGATTSDTTSVALMVINGWAQGMGRTPCVPTMVHRRSQRERGVGVAAWIVAHSD